MANETPHDESDERRMTTDPEQIREWAESRDAVPVSTHGGEGHGHSFVHRDELGADHEEYTWDEFAETFENEDLVFVYHDEEKAGESEKLGSFELVERDRAFERADLGRDEFEDSLRRGETVTTEIVETQVVETQVVERDTIESEVVESDVAEREVVGSELLSRELIETEFVDDERIRVTVSETYLDTVEEIERYTVESRVVDVDVEHHEDLESDTIETDIELESVQRSILESDVIRADVTPDDVLQQEVIQSNRTEGDAVRSELIERRTIEEEVDEQRRLQFVLDEAELLTSEVVTSELLEGEIIDVEEYGTIETTADSEIDRGEHADRGHRAGPMTGMEHSTGSETGADADADVAAGESTPIELSADDQGKDVVDERGETIGIITEVDEGMAYVDPQPGVTDRLKARLDWGGHSDDEYPIEPAQITEITDDEIVIRGE